jgi:hypothetical protein
MVEIACIMLRTGYRIAAGMPPEFDAGISNIQTPSELDPSELEPKVRFKVQQISRTEL